MPRATIEASLLLSDRNIGHQVNCQGRMGRGVARQIRQRYPVVFEEYARYCGQYRSDRRALLGMVQPVRVDNGKTVFNLFGQLSYGVGLHTDYDALQAIARKLRQRNIAIDLPWGMGCGLGGGRWEVVREIFELVEGRWFRLPSGAIR